MSAILARLLLGYIFKIFLFRGEKLTTFRCGDIAHVPIRYYVTFYYSIHLLTMTKGFNDFSLSYMSCEILADCLRGSLTACPSARVSLNLSLSYHTFVCLSTHFWKFLKRIFRSNSNVFLFDLYVSYHTFVLVSNMNLNFFRYFKKFFTAKKTKQVFDCIKSSLERIPHSKHLLGLRKNIVFPRIFEIGGGKNRNGSAAFLFWYKRLLLYTDCRF